MKLEVTKWITDFLADFFKQLLERLFRIVLFCLPLGVYLILIEFRNKVSSISNISVFTEDNSVWQHIFPGFILVAVDPMLFKNEISKRHTAFQKWVERNKYILSFLLALAIVVFMLLHR